MFDNTLASLLWAMLNDDIWWSLHLAFFAMSECGVTVSVGVTHGGWSTS